MLSPLVARAPAAERAALVTCIVLLAGAAWIGLLFSNGSGLFHLHHLPRAVTTSATFLLFFLASWTVMTVGMMLPSAIPVLATLHSFARDRTDRVLLLGLAAGGYLLTWAAVGALVYGANLGIGWVTASWPSLWERLPGPPLLLLLAGGFQFTSLKYKCAEKCRSPFGVVVEHWQGVRERWQAFRLGIDHGIFCAGCCWALMLLMFAVGAGSATWMALLAIVMAVEKSVKWGRRISAPMGYALLAWGGALLLLQKG